jgi:hypothetical protein
MKRIFLSLLITFLFSCKKDSDISNLQNTIAGSWEYENFIGYPFINRVSPPGNGKIIVIGKDGSFKRFQHDTLMFSGKYTLTKKNDCYQRNSNIVFSTNEYPDNDYRYIELNNGELTLSTPNCYQDGGTVYYRRIE